MNFIAKFIAELKYFRSLIIKLLLFRFIVVFLVFVCFGSAHSQWEKIALPDTLENSFLLDVQFLKSNPDYGWACGYKGVVLRTIDRGNNWIDASVPNPYMQLESIQFLDENVGYTSGTGLIGQGKIYKSVDGGNTWTDVTPNLFYGSAYPRLLWGCYFLNENLGVDLGGDCNDQYIYKTTNGGTSWTRKAYKEYDTKFSDALLYDDGSGWAVSSGLLWATFDYGDNWETYAATGERDWQEELAYLDGSFLLPYDLNCDGSQNDAGGARFIYDDNLIEAEFGKAMYGALLLSKESGWVCGSEGYIFFTSDAGNTWELTDCGIEGQGHLDDIWFIDDTLGFVVGQGIYRTARLDIPKPEIVANTNEILCTGEEVELSTHKDYSYYEWSTGEKQRSIKVDTTGFYSVFAYNSKCDSGTVEIYVEFLELPEFELSAEVSGPYCEGDTVILTVEPDSLDYVWSNRSTSKSISVTTSGKYEVTGTKSNGCGLTKSFDANFNPTPKPTIEASKTTSFCIGDSVYLETIDGMAEYRWYKEDSNELVATGRAINVKDSGSYFVEVVSDSGCTALSGSILINVRRDTNQLQFSYNYPENVFDFGSVLFPEMLCNTIEITNISRRTARIDNLILDWNMAFSIPPSQFPVLLMPDETIPIEICYTPRKIDTERDTLTLPDNCWPHLLPLAAVGKGKTMAGN